MDLANNRGISLLSLAGKVFCTITQTRIQKKTEETLSESVEALWTNCSPYVNWRKNSLRLGAHSTAAI